MELKIAYEVSGFKIFNSRKSTFYQIDSQSQLKYFQTKLWLQLINTQINFEISLLREVFLEKPKLINKAN